MEVNYIAQIFPKSITEKIYNEHLRLYSETLIDHLAEVQKLVSPQYHQLVPYGIYLCPLCLRNHFIKTTSGVIGTSEFSLDHLPPKNSGGTFKLITCKKCNNDSGTAESELENILNFAVDKANTGAIKPFKVQILNKETGKSIQGITHHRNGQTEVKFDEDRKKYNADYKDFLRKLHSNDLPKLTVQVPIFNAKKIEQALLKSAYLLCFVWWGYEFVFSENGAFIRDVIAGKKRYPCRVPLNWLEKEKMRKTGISIMQDGQTRMSFLVDIHLKGIEVSTTATIAIPSPTLDGWAKIAVLNDMDKAKEIKALTCTSLPRIVDRIGYSISWGLVVPRN